MKGRVKEGGGVSVYWFTPQMTSRPVLGQVVVRSLEFYPAISQGWQGPKHLAVFCCFPRDISRKLD